MTEPYYDDGTCRIFHGDSRELASELNEIDAVVTDPPYGIRYGLGKGGKGWAPGKKTFTGRDLVAGDDEPFDPSPWLNYPVVVLCGANHYADRLPSSSEWIVWDKRCGIAQNDFADCELIWTNKGGVARVFRHLWNGLVRDSERGQTRVHPTQKPLALMSYLVERYTKPGDLILDPFMGSGTTLVAAKAAGRQAIGIEVSEHYCDVAAKRLAQGSLFEVGA